MKTRKGGLCRRFPAARLVLCAVLVAALAGMLATPARAWGIISHGDIAGRATDLLDGQAYPELKKLLVDYRGVVNYGAMHPDWVYAMNYEGLGDFTVGEPGHDTGAVKNGATPEFRAALAARLLPAFRRVSKGKGSVEDKKAIAFLFGLISHQEADNPFHFGEGSRHGLQPWAEQNGIGHAPFELSLDLILYDGDSVEWFLPREAAVSAYKAIESYKPYCKWYVSWPVNNCVWFVDPLGAGIGSSGIWAQQNQYNGEVVLAKKTDALYIGSLLKLLGVDTKSGIINPIASFDPGGLIDSAEHTVNAWKWTWDWLSTYPVTSISLSPAQPDGSDGSYQQPVTVTLGVTDNFVQKLNEGSLHLDPYHTKYSLNGGAYRDYSGPFTISLEGVNELAVYSYDSGGNHGAVQKLTVTIDLPGTEPPPVGNDGVDQTGPTWLRSLILHFNKLRHCNHSLNHWRGPVDRTQPFFVCPE